MPNRVLRAGIAAAALVAAGSFAVAVGTPRASAEPECLTGSNDYNGDGQVDVAIGAPGHPDYPGAVEVRLSNDDSTSVVHLDEPGPGTPNDKAGDQFGAAVAEIADYHEEGEDTRCSLLVVGAPGRDVDGNQDAGAVFLFQYDRSTEKFALLHEYHQGSDGVPGTPQAGARFGAVLASPYHHDDTAPVVTPLYVGIPGATVNGQKGAGAVASLTFGGGETPTVAKGVLVTQDSAGVPGHAEAGDGLGSALAATQVGVLAGTPGEDIGSATNAGSFLYWHTDPAARTLGVNQGTAGIPGSVEPGDKFGSALYAMQEGTEDEWGNAVLVGTPHENIGEVVDAGMVTTIPLAGGSLDLAHANGASQNKDGVAGTAEAYDYFGEALGSYTGGGPLVGAPGEDVGDVADAGMVQTLSGNRSWTEKTTGQPGKVEAGDRFGATIGNALVPYEGLEDWWLYAVLIGVPGEDDARGAVVHGLVGPDSDEPEEWKAQQPRVGDKYGSALGKFD